MQTAPRYLAAAAPFRTGRRLDSRADLAARAITILACVTAAAVGFTITDAGAGAHAVSLAGPDLTRLLRAMAAIKAIMALATLGAVLWRLGAPVGPARLTAYALGCAAMAAGPGLIWGMAHVGFGALLLHGGLAGCVVVLWRDPATGALLAAELARRKQSFFEKKDQKTFSR